jgi:hypothetical protein
MAVGYEVASDGAEEELHNCNYVNGRQLLAFGLRPGELVYFREKPL